MSESSLHAVESSLITGLLVLYAVGLLLRALSRTRPLLKVGQPIVFGFFLRLVAAGIVSLSSAASSLRGGDESTFLAFSHDVVTKGLLSHSSLNQLSGSLHVWLFALQQKLLNSPDFALRITQVGITMIGLTLMVAAVYDLAGPRAASIAGWLLAIEPTSIFFGGLLHKEALMFLAEGLIVFGTTQAWRRGPRHGLIPIALGGAIGVCTRPYAGWFLVAASAAVLLHSALRPGRRGSAQSMTVLFVLAVLAVPVVPTLIHLTSKQSLASLQSSQTANATDASHLKLDKINFSSRGQVIVNLPRRILDVATQPYPWQLGSTSQRIGLFGTLFVLATIAALVLNFKRSRGQLMTGAAPMIYTGAFTLVAYSLAAGNAGTGFRYRSHVEVIALAAAVILHFRSRAPARLAVSPIPTRESRDPGTLVVT